MQQNRYLVIEPYPSPYPNPMIFRKGERITIGKEFTDDPDWKDWLWCRGDNNYQAWVPKQFIDIAGKKGIMNRDYNALELSIGPGERLTVYEAVNGFGWAVKDTGEKGWVPMKNLSAI